MTEDGYWSPAVCDWAWIAGRVQREWMLADDSTDDSVYSEKEEKFEMRTKDKVGVRVIAGEQRSRSWPIRRKRSVLKKLCMDERKLTRGELKVACENRFRIM